MATAPSIPNTATAATRARAADFNGNFSQVFNFVTDESHSLAVSGIKANRYFSGHTSTDSTVNVGDNENLDLTRHEITSGTTYNITATAYLSAYAPFFVLGTLNNNGTTYVI